MSLKIERFKKKSEDWITSHVQKFITNQTGHDIPFTIDWESFGKMEEAEELFKKGLTYRVLESNLKSLCSDELGKKSFHENVTAIVIRHTDAETNEEMLYELKRGKLYYYANHKSQVYGLPKEMNSKLEGLF